MSVAPELCVAYPQFSDMTVHVDCPKVLYANLFVLVCRHMLMFRHARMHICLCVFV